MPYRWTIPLALLLIAPTVAAPALLGAAPEAVASQLGSPQNTIVEDAPAHSKTRTYAVGDFQVRVVFRNGQAQALEYSRPAPGGSVHPLTFDDARKLLEQHRNNSSWREQKTADHAFRDSGGPHQSKMVVAALQTTRWIRGDGKAVAEFDRTHEVFRVMTPTYADTSS